MKEPERRAIRSLRWFPRAWRESGGAEFAAFLEDSMRAKPVSLRRGASVALYGLGLRSSSKNAHQRVLVATSASVVVLLGALFAASSGFGLLASTGSAKESGFVPVAGGIAELSRAPRYLAVESDGRLVGYVRRDQLLRESPSPIEGLPVYGAGLKALVGHLAAAGYLPLGRPSTLSANDCLVLTWTAPSGHGSSHGKTSGLTWSAPCKLSHLDHPTGALEAFSSSRSGRSTLISLSFVGLPGVTVVIEKGSKSSLLTEDTGAVVSR